MGKKPLKCRLGVQLRYEQWYFDAQSTIAENECLKVEKEFRSIFLTLFTFEFPKSFLNGNTGKIEAKPFQKSWVSVCLWNSIQNKLCCLLLHVHMVFPLKLQDNSIEIAMICSVAIPAIDFKLCWTQILFWARYVLAAIICCTMSLWLCLSTICSHKTISK